VLPERAGIIAAAARAFDDVEYGEYTGSAEDYRLISEADESLEGAHLTTSRPSGGAR
jgi:hypothetical protein